MINCTVDENAVKMYQTMMNIVSAHKEDTLYDVDMFIYDVKHELFIETDVQDIDEDDYIFFQEALILLIRNDLFADYFGINGLIIIYIELISAGKSYYINKALID